MQIFDISKFFELASIQCINAGAGRCSQRLQLARILRLALLHQPQPVTQHFACVLVPAGLDQGFNQVCLPLPDVERINNPTIAKAAP